MTMLEVKGQLEFINSKEEAAELLYGDSEYRELGKYLLATFKEEAGEGTSELEAMQAARQEAEGVAYSLYSALNEVQDVLDRLDNEDASKRTYKARMQAALAEIQQVLDSYI